MTGQTFGIVAAIVLVVGLVVDAVRVRFKRRRIVDGFRTHLMAPEPPPPASHPSDVTADDVERAEAALQLLAGGDKGKGDRP